MPNGFPRLPTTPDVPIIGQPRFDIPIVTLMPLVTCSCGASINLIAQTRDGRMWTGVPVQCVCQKFYIAQGIQITPDGQFQIAIDVKTVEQMIALQRDQADAAEHRADLNVTVHG